MLEENIELALRWIENNTDKCHLIFSGHKHDQIWVQVGVDKTWESVDVDRLGITIYIFIHNELEFDT